MRQEQEQVLDDFQKRLYAVAVEDVRLENLRVELQPLRVHKARS
jgi:hypothetical protein